MTNEKFLYSFFFEKDIKNLLKLDFKSTDGTDFNKNGDYFVKMLYNNLECYYIIDYGLNNDDRFKYNPLYIISKNDFIVRSEVIIFKDTYDGVKEIYCFPKMIINKKSIYEIIFYDNKSNMHNLNGAAFNHIEIDNNDSINYYSIYYINGKEIDSKLYNRFLKIKKIKKCNYLISSYKKTNLIFYDILNK